MEKAALQIRPPAAGPARALAAGVLVLVVRATTVSDGLVVARELHLGGLAVRNSGCPLRAPETPGRRTQRPCLLVGEIRP